MDYISIPVFILSFALGIFSVYMTNPPKDIIYVYPTPSNVKQIQYKDNAGQCFEYEAVEVKCIKSASSYPFQG